VNGWALITGASHGIGRDVARLAAVDVSGILLTGRDEPALAALAREVARPGLTVETCVADLAATAGVDALLERAARFGTPPDLLVNNAGLGAWGLSRDLPPSAEQTLIAVNIAALVRLTQAFQGPMVARGSGRILNVASTAAFQAGPRMAVYYASKAFVLHYSEALAHELAGTGVTVTALCPGPTHSEFHERAGTRRSTLVVGGILPVAKSAAVARAGYRGALAGRRVVVPGVINRWAVFLVRFAPRRWATAIAAFVARPATDG
jgi:short-subunit dehydrogenase